MHSIMQAFLFVKDDTWTERQIISTGNPADFDRFGISVAMFQESVYVGAPWDDHSGRRDTGSIYVFGLHGLTLLIAGGVVYTVGVLFYAVERLPYNHALWHLFVLGGSICHFFAMRSLIMSVT
jgi:hypothetical protein